MITPPKLRLHLRPGLASAILLLVSCLDPETLFAQDKPQFRKLDSSLNQLVSAVPGTAPGDARRAAAVSETLEAAGLVEYGSGRVGVTIRYTGPADPLRLFVAAHGGHVAHAVDGVLEAYIAPSDLPELGNLAMVGKVTAIRRAEPLVISQGVQVHNGAPWQAANYLGQGVKVGIIELGYQGWSSLPLADRPIIGAARCVLGGGAWTSDFTSCQTFGDHGTAVTEAMHDMVPNATFYLATYITNGDILAAVQWMVQNGVKVINLSQGLPWDGPGDGTSPYATSPLKAVDVAVAGGAVVTISSGNAGENTWFGPWVDQDFDDLLNFSPTDDTNCTFVTAGQSLSFQLRWDGVWGGTARDLDLELWHLGSTTRVARSNSTQNGDPWDEPYESITYTAPLSGTYCVMVYRFGGSLPGWVQLQARNSAVTLEYYFQEGSLSNPAETANPGALTVGAANWQTPSAIETFSSSGPTPDGRVKPDIVGVDAADSFTKGPNGFSGTSQSAPHVAGLAAIAVQGYPADSPASVVARLKGWALPRGGTIPNNTWGYGLAYLPTVYALTVSRVGSGLGTVTSVDTLVNCGLSCVQTYFSAAVTTLSANPSVGSTFTGWSGGGCTGTGTCTITMNSATTVTATFTAAPTSYTLSVAKAGTGTGTVSSNVAGISCGVSCSASFPSGSQVTLTATPSAGSLFGGWAGACVGLGPCVVTLDQARAVAATFNPPPVTHLLTVTKAGAATGTVTSETAGAALNCGLACSVAVAAGTTVTLTAQAGPGVLFAGWSGPCSGTGVCSVVVNQATDVVASFDLSAVRTYYLAEGATGPFFDLDVVIANPNAQDVPVAMTFLDASGNTYPLNFTLPSMKSRTVAVETEVPALASADVSTIVTSLNGLPLIVERSLFWDATYYGGHTGNAVDGPQTTWYFGEGFQSSPSFDTFILLANSNPTPANVTLTFLRQGATPVSTTKVVGATSRANFWAAELAAELDGQSFSTVVTSNIPIIAERAMYFGSPLFSGGHESAGVPAPATNWFHPEGRTGPFFDTYILIGNPGTVPANVTVRFLRANDTPITTSLTVAAQGRETVYVDGVQGLPDTDVSTEVSSDVPVISERAMYWPGEYAQWYEAHNSFGVTSTGVAWGLAEGRFGFPQKFETYILLTNPTDTTTRVRVTFLRQGNRAPIASEQVLGANTRANVDMTALLTAPDYNAAGERFGAVVESLDNVGIAVERAMYFTTSSTQFWNGGTNATAVKLR